MDILVNPNYQYLNTFIDISKRDFLAGRFFTETRSQFIFNKLTCCIYNYLQRVDHIKKILTKARLKYIYDVLFIRTGSNLSEEDKLILIRYINICQKDKYIIVLNNKLIYTPSEYNQYEKMAIQYYINSILKRHNTCRKFNIIKYKVKKYIKNLINKI